MSNQPQAFSDILVLGNSTRVNALLCKCPLKVNLNTSINVTPTLQTYNLIMSYALQFCEMGMYILCKLAQSMVAL